MKVEFIKPTYRQGNDIWTRAFLRYLYREYDKINLESAVKIFNEFHNVDMELRSKITDFSPLNGPILICVVKNEVERMKVFFRHYRDLSVRHFAMIDNNSNDGTLEWILDQDGTDVFNISSQYSRDKKVAWINKVLCYYGHESWYIVVDSDELIDYVGSESLNMEKIINISIKNNIKRIRGLQVNMYSAKPLFSRDGSSLGLEENIYFDRDSYEDRDSDRCVLVVGGPRKRLLKTFSVLTKYPVFYFGVDDLFISNHYLYPYKENFKSDCLIAILHYEFINQKDLDNVHKIAISGIYASNSKEYKVILKTVKDNDELFCIYPETIKYENSSSLTSIGNIKSFMQLNTTTDWKTSRHKTVLPS